MNVDQLYAVIRLHPQMPRGFLPPGYEGRWVLKADVPDFMGDVPVLATGRYERRDDGVRAEVYEVGG